MAEMQKNLDRRGGPESLLMTASPDKEFTGKTLARVAQERGVSPIEAALTVIQKGGADVASFNMQQTDIKNFMRQDWVMTCSDGSPGHPRKYGTFPEKLRKYVFDEQVITLPFAIRSSTSLPAETLSNIPPRLLGEDVQLVSVIGALDAKLLLVLEAARLVPDSVWSAIMGPGDSS